MSIKYILHQKYIQIKSIAHDNWVEQSSRHLQSKIETKINKT